jgi:carbonic anhydrase
MEKILRGIHEFQTVYFDDQKEFFEKLVGQQLPRALFITCSDSRVMPNLITQTDAGELFLLRNAGNIIPPYGSSAGGEPATIEYAVSVLGVKHVIVCGHSHCGAMGAILHPEKVKDYPSIVSWLSHAEATRRIIKYNYVNQELSDEELLLATIKENVLVQLENLRTHPSIAVRLSQGDLQLHAWVYQIETGKIFAYDTEQNRYCAIAPDAMPSPIFSRKKLSSLTMTPE